MLALVTTLIVTRYRMQLKGKRRRRLSSLWEMPSSRPCSGALPKVVKMPRSRTTQHRELIGPARRGLSFCRAGEQCSIETMSASWAPKSHRPARSSPTSGGPVPRGAVAFTPCLTARSGRANADGSCRAIARRCGCRPVLTVGDTQLTGQRGRFGCRHKRSELPPCPKCPLWPNRVFRGLRRWLGSG